MHKLKLFFTLLALSVVACSGPGQPPNEATGSIGAAITVSGSVTLTSLTYSIVGPQTYSGTVAVGAQAIQFQVGDVQDGTYSVTLTGTDSAGFSCAGSTSGIVVHTDATAACAIAVICGADAGLVTQNADAGEIAITATVSADGGNVYCSSLQGITVTNTDLPSNGTIPFVVNETGSALVTFSWSPDSADGGFATGTTPLAGSCTPIWQLPASYTGPYYGESTGPASLWCPGSICSPGTFTGSYTFVASVTTGPGDPCIDQPGQTASVTITCD
jgi:hypothetical protein